jgi:hypothetical protein
MVVLQESFAPARWGRRPRPACPSGPAARLGMSVKVIMMSPCIFCIDNHPSRSRVVVLFPHACACVHGNCTHVVIVYTQFTVTNNFKITWS